MTNVGITGAAGGIGSMLVDGLGDQYELTLFDVDIEVRKKYGDDHNKVVADFLVAYAISDNDNRIFDMKESMEKLGFDPQDNSEDFFNRA